MSPWLGAVLAGLGLFLTAGLLTIIGSAVRESVLPPGVEPDAVRRRRARFGIAGTAIVRGARALGRQPLVVGRSVELQPVHHLPSVRSRRDDRAPGRPARH